ncbi:FAST kinase domain-containing protein 4 isoform X3 [Colius striatus]|uniref:FAST kinase domain-containing protein 4 isoform X3 n=1 Tax=Colius striatus TaxID=57412 RepID=UPI002B1D35D2|nr:FAST kinase domain-containing protein 4 isoform X3 [Colius striatus]
MAAHLVRRCCWRHLGAFLCPSSAIPASLLAGKLATTRRALPHPPLSSFHTSSPWRWADGFSVKEQVEESGNAEYKVIEELIETASTPHELLQLSELHSLNSNQASLIITQLSRLTAEKKLEAGSILQDGRFQQLISITDSQISQVWNNTLVNLLKSLYCLGLDSSSREMQSVEQEVLWRLRRLSFRQLSSLAEFLAPRESKDSKLLSELIKKLELRWTELEGTRSVVAMMGKVGHISPALMDRLEDKALELAEQFSPDDVRKITLALAYQNRRCVPLLRALSYHLVQKHSELSLSVLMDLIFAYAPGVPEDSHGAAAPRAQHDAPRADALHQILGPPQVAQPAALRGRGAVCPGQNQAAVGHTPLWYHPVLCSPQLPAQQQRGLLQHGPRGAAGAAGQAGASPADRAGVVPVRAAAGQGSLPAASAGARLPRRDPRRPVPQGSELVAEADPHQRRCAPGEPRLQGPVPAHGSAGGHGSGGRGQADPAAEQPERGPGQAAGEPPARPLQRPHALRVECGCRGGGER